MAHFNYAHLIDAPKALQVLEIGCGQFKRVPYSTALDSNSSTKADVIHDLNVVPYPFSDDTFDVVIAEHVLEHLDDVVKVVGELYRISKPNAMWYIEVPHYSSSNFFTDPTHKHAFSTRSFDYFVPDTVLAQYRYSKVTLTKKEVLLVFENNNRLRRKLGQWANHNQEIYERRYAFMLPSLQINFELKIVK